jgi:4-amino-4-deoxy-L-arabinose transferase-like glycosyltransferase
MNPPGKRLFYQNRTALLLIAIVLLAAALRGWQLGALPPGLYRDEAYNGLDALSVLEEGARPLYFAANNGREPLYIYLSALSVHVFGRTPFALRLPAAIAGSLTVLPVFLLAAAWFGRRVGLTSALLWAITFWPLHLGRIGLRVSLLPGLAALLLWLLTLAWRRQHARFGGTGWWLLAGMVHGLAWYTYLSARLIPVFLILFSGWLWLMGRRRPEWRALAAFGLGSALLLAPLAAWLLAHPALLTERTGQVSIFNAAINGGELPGTLWRNLLATAGMFLWKGDGIGRHNLPYRPIFDPLMALPFLIGLAWCVRAWRKPPAAALLLWVALMSLGTLLAEDAPHFLRAAGILPLVLIFPALGLSQLAGWSKLPAGLRAMLPVVLVAGSLLITINDYFVRYAPAPQTARLFEAAAESLARSANADAGKNAVLIARRLPEGWPSLRFLLDPAASTSLLDPETVVLPFDKPTTLYLWPLDNREWLDAAIIPPLRLALSEGEPAQGDLEPQPYPLWLRVQIEPGAAAGSVTLADFDGRVQLLAAERTPPGDNALALTLTLTWQAHTPLPPTLKAFVHVTAREDGALIGQRDAPPGGTYANNGWWQPGVVVAEQRTIPLTEPFDPARHRILIGLYDEQTMERLPIISADAPATTWEWHP